MSDLIGRKLGKYELVERLGRGGMAAVYKAYQPGVERHVALKVMHSHLSDNAEFVQRFQREARSIGQLQHTHIGRVIDFDVEADVYYMVMDYLQGGTLDSYLKQKGLLPADEAVRITLQLADALAYAHERGMIHRDIKPGNVMFMDEAHTHALLTDFGIARLLTEQSNMTMTGALVGTPNYMSPEAARGEPCDARSDIYSLGVVLYELVTGRTPYAADTPYSFLMKQANEPLPPPRTLNPQLLPALETILLKALAKDPKARYQSATDLATALRQMQAGSEATATGNLPMTQPKKSRTPLVLAGIGVLVVAIVTLLALLRLDNGAPPATSTPTSTPTSAVSAVIATATPPPTASPTTEAPPAATASSEAASVTAPLPISTTLTSTTPTDTTPTDTAALTESVTVSSVASAPPLTATTVTATAAVSAATPISTTAISTTVATAITATAATTVAATVAASTTATLVVTAPITTVTTVITPAVTVTTPLLAAAPLGTLQFVDTETTAAGGFQLTLNQMRLPPANHHYELWLVGDGDVAYQLGNPTVEQGRIRYQGASEQNLLAGYTKAELRIVPDSGDGASEVVLTSSQPPALVAALRGLLIDTESSTEAERPGALPKANEQWSIAMQHGGFLADALAAEDFDEARRHAEHIINLLDGATGAHYGDLNGDGQAQNPGDGYGVRTYLTDANVLVATAVAALTQTTSLPFYADRVTAAQQNSVAAIDTAIETTLKVFAADTVQEAQPFAEIVNAHITDVRHGRDLDENGVIDPLLDEGGTLAAYAYALQMAAYTFYSTTDVAPTTLVTATQPVGFLRFTDGAPLTGTDATTDASYGGSSYGSVDDGYGSSSSTATDPDAPVPASRFTLELNHLPLPPAGQHYVLWLATPGGESHAMSALPLAAHVILTGTTEENLLLEYRQALITSEPIGALPAQMGEQILFSGEHSVAFMEPFRTALFVSEPFKAGLLAGAHKQMETAVAHSGFLQDALDSDLAEARRHAEHIINILEGKTGKHFGDLDGDGMAQNPGDGFGVRTYLVAAREAMTQATAVMTATADSRFFAERYLAAHDHTLDLLERSYEKALQIFAADSADEARPFAAELRTLLQATLAGEDRDSNGVIDPLADEGGILVLQEAGLRLGEIALYRTERPTAPQ